MAKDTEKREVVPIKIDFTEMTEGVLQQMKDDGKIEELLRTHVEQAMSRAFESAFGSFSDFRKQIEEHLKEQLNLNLKEFTLVEYNKILSNMFKDMLDKNLVLKGKDLMESQMAELLKPLQDQKLSEFVEYLKGAWAGDEAYERVDTTISFHLEKSTYSDGRIYLYFLYIDEDPDKDKYRCDIRLTLSPLKEYSDKGEKAEVANEFYDGKEYVKARVSGATYRGTDMNKIMTTGNIYDVERRLFQMFAQGIVMEMDEDRVDEYYRIED